MASWISGALTTCESSVNAVWVPMLAAVKSAQVLARLALELHGRRRSSPRCWSSPELAFLIWSPLMIDLSSR